MILFTPVVNNHTVITSLTLLIQALSITSDGSTRTKLEWAFKLYDIDNSGTISRDEITKVFESIYSLVSRSEHFREEVERQSIEER